MKAYEKGTSLLELMIAVVMICTVVAMVALFFPKASATMTNNKQHALAVSFASSRLQELKAMPYAVIPLTAYSASYFSSNATIAPPGGCDCSTVADSNWANLPTPQIPPTTGADATYTEDGMTYSRYVCINLVSGTSASWTSYCPDIPNHYVNDTGLKNIHVRVSWTSNGISHFTDQESLVTR